MSAADDIIGLYDRNAAGWEADRGEAPDGGAPFEKPWLDRFAALLPAGGSLLDIGCGSGDPLARYLLAAGFALDGADSSAGLIAICRGKFPDRTWTVADMRRLDMGRSYDGLLVWHSLIHLTPEDQRGVFPHLRRHAHAGTVLMFTSGPDHGERVGQWCGEPLYHGSLGPAEYLALLNDNGFDVLDHVVADPACGHATIWLARCDEDRSCR